MTSKGYDGFMQGLGLVFPFNLMTNSLAIGKEVSVHSTELTGAFDDLLTDMIAKIKKFKNGGSSYSRRKRQRFKFSKRQFGLNRIIRFQKPK